MKKELGKLYCKDKNSFKLNIQNTLEKINSEVSTNQFDSLFTFKFQSYENSQILMW